MRVLRPLAFIAAPFVVAALLIAPTGVSQPAAGTTLTFTDTYWRCTQPLSTYATNGLPLTVRMTFTRAVVPPTGAGVVQLGQGCTGPGQDGEIDLILEIEGDGLTYGSGDDAIRHMNASPGPTDMDITGHADCGPRQGSAHQDGIQILGGRDVAYWNFTIGDYDAGKSTCQGAGGAVFYSLASQNVDFFGGSFISCNHALLAGTSSPGAEVRNARFRSGYPAGDQVCSGYAVSNPCDIRAAWGGTTENLTCDRFPFDDVPPPPPPPAPQCSNGIDDDDDTLIDFPNDPGCEAAGDTSESPDPPPPPPPVQCADGLDNDGDGLVDLADPGCESALDDDETNAPPSDYNPACRPTCDEQISALSSTVAAKNEELAALQAKIAAALAALQG